MDNNQIDNNKNLTNDPKSNNQSRSIRNIETMFDGSRGHLTDFEAETKIMRRWTLNKYVFYMRIALIFSSIPVPFQLILVALQMKHNYIIMFLVELVGTSLMLYRSVLILNLVNCKSPTVESVQYTIKVVIIAFLYYNLNTLLLFLTDSADGYILENTLQLVIVYTLINFLINIPDYYVLNRLLYYLIYDHDDNNSSILGSFNNLRLSDIYKTPVLPATTDRKSLNYLSNPIIKTANAL